MCKAAELKDHTARVLHMAASLSGSAVGRTTDRARRARAPGPARARDNAQTRNQSLPGFSGGAKNKTPTLPVFSESALKKTPTLPGFSGGAQKKKTPGPNRKEARTGHEPRFPLRNGSKAANRPLAD